MPARDLSFQMTAATAAKVTFSLSNTDSTPVPTVAPPEPGDERWRSRLGLLWLGQVVSHLGDALFISVMFFVALEVTGSSSMSAALVALNFLPALALGLFAGALVDRSDRRKIMLWADLSRALSVGAIPILHAVDLLTPSALGAAVFCLATGATLFNPAIKSLVPRITPAQHLTAAVSGFQVAEYGALVAGPLLAAILIPLIGSINLLLVDAATFLFSAGCIALLPLVRDRKPTPLSSVADNALPLDLRATWHEAISGARQVWAVPSMRALLVIGTLNNFAIMGLAHVATPLLVTKTLGLNAAAYSQTLGLFFLGMTLASAAFWLFGHSFPKGPTILVGIVLDGLTFIPYAFCSTIGQLGIAQFVHALFIPLIIIPRTVMIQKTVPAHLHGRAFALVNVTVFGMMALSSGLVGGLAEWLSPSTLFLVLGSIGALPGLFGFLMPSLRGAR